MAKPRYALANEKATELLRAHRIDAPIVNVEHIARAQGLEIKYHPYSGEDSMAGMLVRHPGKKPLIGVNAEDPPQRQRFTIAHELGHFILHNDEVHVDAYVQFRDRLSTTAEQVAEVEANQFAANLLMPASFLRRDISNMDVIDLDDATATLAKRYDVSVAAMALRLAKLLRYDL